MRTKSKKPAPQAEPQVVGVLAVPLGDRKVQKISDLKKGDFFRYAAHFPDENRKAIKAIRTACHRYDPEVRKKWKDIPEFGTADVSDLDDKGPFIGVQSVQPDTDVVKVGEVVFDNDPRARAMDLYAIADEQEKIMRGPTMPGTYYTTYLSSVGNPDFDQNPNRPVSPPKTARGATIEELRSKVEEYIEEYNLGGGNFPMPEVKDQDGKVVGFFSYNLRFWTPEEKRKMEEGR